MNESEQQRPWWAEYELGIGEVAGWEIGPLRLWLQRGAAEWRMAHDWVDAHEQRGWRVVRPAVFPEGNVEAERFALSATDSGVRLRPLPADRPVVARPKTPFRVLPGQQSRVYVSAPLWVETSVTDGGVVLSELPTKRLSDTWFGSTTREGELCYVLRTNARTELEEMPRASYRLLTPVVIQNRSETALLVERLNLPVPFLSIYRSTTRETWSEEVHMLWKEGGDMAELDIRKGAPAEARGAALLGAPRRLARKGHVFRAFGSLLGFDF